MNLILLCGQAVKIAEKAGEEIIKIYEKESWDVRFKSDRSPVTLADMASNRIICADLLQLYPHIPVISEEDRIADYSERKNYESYWLIDPLDGTKEFIKKNGEFAVNIALIRHNKPVLGVVRAPALRETFWAAKGQGAFMIKNGLTAKITCAPFKTSDAGIRALTSRSHVSEAAETALSVFSDPVLIPMGSALKFTAIAKGEADFYCRIGPTMEWDTAAPQIILEEAGGFMFAYDDLDGSVIGAMEACSPMLYNKEDLHNPDFIAYGRLIC